MSVTISSFYVKQTLIYGKDCYIKCTATQIEHKNIVFSSVSLFAV